jgi:hypothetical protein
MSLLTCHRALQPLPHSKPTFAAISCDQLPYSDKLQFYTELVEEKVKLNREGSVYGIFQLIFIQRVRKALKHHQLCVSEIVADIQTRNSTNLY